jgi:hypothetical protein
MRVTTLFIACLIFLTPVVFCQPDLGYFLPEEYSYSPDIPTPKSVIGHEVGEWHVTHDKLIQYMYALDKASDRISLEITGYTHESRPLLLLTITSPQNHTNIETIRKQHVQLTDPSTAANVDLHQMPAVFYMGFSVHGNEASGSNAALLMAYHLAAAQGKEIEEYLTHTVILFDPCFNPDGMQRFSSWVNARKSKVITTDPNDTEHQEAWPGGRFNHYWFDLNRDWLVAQHPESQARIRTFHQWKPNVLTDHHEMGTNSTFFFQPGVRSRNHPLTPDKNYELTRRIGEFHAKALDAIGSRYYTQEDFDDFYYGKGSTFPDAQGAIGILFEQASSRGHAQESVNGVLRFEFAIRNQFTTAMSSLKAVNALREDLLQYQRQFFKDAAAEAAKDPVKSIVVKAPDDQARLFHFAEMIARQDIRIYPQKVVTSVAGKNIEETGFVIPLAQPQYKLIKSMFEKRTSFTDSIFYDISSWTLPLAFGVDYEEMKSVPSHQEALTTYGIPAGQRIGGKSEYAYAFETSAYYAPRAIYRLLRHGLKIKVATQPFRHTTGKQFERGSILLHLSGQERTPDQIEYILQEIAAQDGIDIYNFPTGLDFNGTSLGSNSFLSLRKPEMAMLVGDGITATDAGELWHLFDIRFNMPVTLITADAFNRANLSRYNTIIVPPTQGLLPISDSVKEKLKSWVQQGGVVIGFENALSWLTSAGLGRFDMKKDEPTNGENKKDIIPEARPYGDIEAYRGAQTTSGAIFQAHADLTHPLMYGYHQPRIVIFKSNNLFMEKAKNAYGNPLKFGTAPLMSGYISKTNYAKIKESSIAGVSALGAGRVIGFTDNLCFRAFWLGTNKMVMNAVFYGHLIDAASSR